MRDLTGRSLLAVFAHPDDESIACGGLLAWCADRGARVSLVCATRGEGRGTGEVRARELEAAATILGLSDVVMLDYADGMLPWVDTAALETGLREAIRQRHPDVVITFGEDGLYWHPDHIAVHERTTAAVAALGPDAPALYYVSMPPGRMRAAVDAVAARTSNPEPPLCILGIRDPDAFGALAPEPTLVVEAGAFAGRKLAAIRCHQSQLADDALAALTDEEAVRFLGMEHFRRASAGSSDDVFLEQFGRGPRADVARRGGNHARRPA